MNIFDKIKSKFKKDNKNSLYCRIYDEYTNATMYFELDVVTNSCKVIDTLPEDAVVTECDDIRIKSIKDSVDRVKEQYEHDVNRKNNFMLSELYHLSMNKNEPRVQEAYRKYLRVKSLLEQKCIRYNIPVLDDEDVIFSKILNRINEYRKKEDRKHITSEELIKDTINFSYSKASIDKEVEREINNKSYNSKKFYFERMHIINYYYSFIQNFPVLLHILDKKVLTDDEKKVVANYLELFKVLPRFMDTLDYLDSSYDKIENSKMDSNFKRYNNSSEFSESITSLLSKVDSEYENIFLHVTTSLEASMSIMQNGLYAFGELDSFCEPYENIEQIFTYQYGSESSIYDEYVILFRLPKNKSGLDSISNEEAQEAMKKITMRRQLIHMQPTGKISSSDILGIVDKKNMKVIPNESFKQLDHEEVNTFTN